MEIYHIRFLFALKQFQGVYADSQVSCFEQLSESPTCDINVE
jgi:hypothetical protein